MIMFFVGVVVGVVFAAAYVVFTDITRALERGDLG